MIKYRTWVSQPVHTDAYWVFVCRYEWDERWCDDQMLPVNVKSFHMTGDGWHEHPEGALIDPALVIPGYLVSHLPWFEDALRTKMGADAEVIQAINDGLRETVS